MVLNMDLLEKMDDPRVRQAVEALSYLKSVGLKVDEVGCLIKYSENEALRKRVYDNLIQLLIDLDMGTKSGVQSQLIKDLFFLTVTDSDDGFVKEWPILFCGDLRQILLRIKRGLKEYKEGLALTRPLSPLCEEVLCRLDGALRVMLEEKVNKPSH